MGATRLPGVALEVAGNVVGVAEVDAEVLGLDLQRSADCCEGRPVCHLLNTNSVGTAYGEASAFGFPVSVPHVVTRESCGHGHREGVLEGSAVAASGGCDLGGSVDAKVDVQCTSNGALQQNDSYVTGGEVGARVLRKLGCGLARFRCGGVLVDSPGVAEAGWRSRASTGDIGEV